MGSFDDLPDLPPAAGILLAALVLVLWILWRTRILRRLEAGRAEGDAADRASLRRPALFLLAALLVAALVWILARA